LVSVGMLRNGTDVFVDVLVDSVFLLGEIGLLDGSAVMVARLGVSVGSTVGLVVGVCLCVVVATSMVGSAIGVNVAATATFTPEDA